MSIQISYKSSSPKKSSNNLILFVDEKFNIIPIKKDISPSEFSYINELLKTSDLSKYLTKSTTDFKIQEKKTSSLLNCYINYFLLDKDYFYDVLNCNDPAIKEMQKELFTRLIKPLFLPVISLSLCFLLLYPKENSNYKFSRVWIFSLGFLIIIFSEITSPLTVRNFLYFKLSLVIPFVIFIIQYIFLFNIINRYKKL